MSYAVIANVSNRYEIDQANLSLADAIARCAERTAATHGGEFRVVDPAVAELLAAAQAEIGEISFTSYDVNGRPFALWDSGDSVHITKYASLKDNAKYARDFARDLPKFSFTPDERENSRAIFERNLRVARAFECVPPRGVNMRNHISTLETIIQSLAA